MKHGLREFPRLRLKLRIVRRVRPIAAARNNQRQRPRGIGHTEMQCGETPHGIADHMRAIYSQRIQHCTDVIASTLLGIALDIVRHIRRRIAARVIGNATIAAREMVQLRFPGAPVARKLVHENDRRT